MENLAQLDFFLETALAFGYHQRLNLISSTVIREFGFCRGKKTATRFCTRELMTFVHQIKLW